MQITLFFFYFLLGFNLSLTLLQATTGIFPISFIFQQTYLMQYMYVYVYIYINIYLYSYIRSMGKLPSHQKYNIRWKAFQCGVQLRYINRYPAKIQL